jgi:hypothetical protein
MTDLERTLPDGRVLYVTPLIGGRGRLHVQAAGDEQFYVDAW